MNKSFLFFKNPTLPANGNSVEQDITGTFFRCSKAEDTFEMSFDGQTFFKFEKGLQFRLVGNDTFQKLWFRTRNGADNTIEFYYGSAQVDDNRLNLIDGSSLDQGFIYTREAATAIATFAATVNNAAILQLVSSGLRIKQRVVTNIETNTVNTIDFEQPLSGLGGRIFASSSFTFNTGADVTLVNNSSGGHPVSVEVLVIYYP